MVQKPEMSSGSLGLWLVCTFTFTYFFASQFPRTWKTVRISPVPKIAHPKSEADYRPVTLILEHFHARLSSATDRTSGDENKLPILVKNVLNGVFFLK